MKRMKTHSLKGAEIEKLWHVVDADGQTLGRLATQAANMLMGKHKPTYSRHLDMGDYVVVVNAEKIHVTGNKLKDKKYYRHTGYMGGIRETTLGVMLQRRPRRVVEMAVRGMLPRSRLGRQLYRHLKVYAGPDHPHEAQVNASRKREAAQPGSAAAATTTEKPS